MFFPVNRPVAGIDVERLDLPPLPAGMSGEADEDIAARIFSGREPQQTFAPGQTLALDGTPVACVFRVLSGVLRLCTITPEGRRQIFRFGLRGDVIGLIDPERWHFTAEAVDEVVVRAAPRAAVDAALGSDTAMLRALRAHVAREIELRERHLLAVAFLPAAERLLWFLEAFARETGRDRAGFVRLPMTRQDIGDHLGMTLETVSRAFGTLRRAGLIEMSGSCRYRVPGRRGLRGGTRELGCHDVSPAS